MKALDPEQLPLRGTTIVEASAGTGKTYTITSLFLRLLIEQELSVDQILVVTYTRAATAELRDRIRKRVALALGVAKGESTDDALAQRLCRSAVSRTSEEALVDRLERALAAVDEAPVLTIHGFCQRVLRDHAFESGSAFDAQLTAHAAPLLDEIVADFFMSELYDAPLERAATLLDEPSRLRDLAARVSGRDLRIVPEHVEEVSFDRHAYTKLLEACRDAFEREREAIILRVQGLKYVGKHAQSRVERVEALLRANEPGEIAGWDMWRKNFTTQGLHENSKNGVGQESAFFALAEELLDHDRRASAAQTGLRLTFRRRFVAYLERELLRRTRETSVRTFDSLLGDLDRALSSPMGAPLADRLAASYRAALVDEFQDTDPLQYRIFRTIFAERGVPLFLIGDPKQAIYGFRGADVAAYLLARGEAEENVYTLDVNYRSDGALIEALNALYARAEAPFLSEAIAYQPIRAAHAHERLIAPDRRGPLDLALATLNEGTVDTMQRDVARAVASDIAALLQSGAMIQDGTRTRTIAAADIAVLCRKNREATQVQLALTEFGVPSVLSGDASVLDSDDVAQVERVLTALAHPGDARALRSFLASIYAGVDAHGLLALESDDARWEQHRERLQRLHETWLSHGFMQALRGLVATYDVERRLLERPDGTRRITNLWHLAELLTEASLHERLGPLGLLRWLALVRDDAAQRSELVGDAHELRLESSEDAVNLTTVHKSKGLEYPIVYCPFSWAPADLMKSDKAFVRFHDAENDAVLTLDLGSPDAKTYEKIAQAEALEESLRLLYVALTRAKHRVTVLLPSPKKLAGSALAYTLFGGGDPEARKAQVSALEGAALHGALESAGFRARPMTVRRSAEYQSRSRLSVTGSARKVKRALDRAFRVASFSALIAKERNAFGEAGIDRDAVVPKDEVEALQSEAPSPLTLGEFPRGAVAGQLVHEVLEHARFDGTHEELSLVASELVQKRGYASALSESLTNGLWEMLHTPLDREGFTLSKLVPRARIDEMEFVFPVDEPLTTRSLARVFKEHAAPPASPNYASDLSLLGFDALRGYLRGFVDLVYRHDGRFYIVDYKSNWLGPVAADYAPSELPRAMVEHHYYLQYHLYTVALHRHLTYRLRNYSYDSHFGGVYYLFLRGMAPHHPFGSGVYYDRPDEALIRALDAALRKVETEVSP